MRKLIFTALVLFVTLSSYASPQARDNGYIQLDPPRTGRGSLLMDALSKRKSSRSFGARELPVELLSDLLWASSGVNRPESGLMTNPSVMNAQEISVFVALKKGVYLYDRKDNKLDLVAKRDVRAISGVQDFTKDAPCVLVFVADYSKMPMADNMKNFYSGIDTGYISQNVYLFCASEGLATVALGWINKPELAKAIGLGNTQKIILVQPVGYKK